MPTNTVTGLFTLAAGILLLECPSSNAFAFTFQISRRSNPMSMSFVVQNSHSHSTSYSRLYSDWSDFAYDDEDEVLDVDFADENDSQEAKAEIGSLLPAPTIEMDAEPIFQPQGTYRAIC